MRIIAAAALWLLAASAAEAQQAAGSTDPPSPERFGGASRIREALQRPALDIPPLPEIATTFRLTIEEKPFPVGSVMDEMWRDIAANPTLPGPGPIPGRAQAPVPLVGVDALPALMGLVNSIRAARRASAERAARKEVQEALAAFCATHDCSVTEPGVSPSEGIVVPAKPAGP
jgi:hypothetical protein